MLYKQEIDSFIRSYDDANASRLNIRNAGYSHLKKCESVVTTSAPMAIAVAAIMASGSLSLVWRRICMVSDSIAGVIGNIKILGKNCKIRFSSSGFIFENPSTSSFEIKLIKHLLPVSNGSKSTAFGFFLRKSIITQLSKTSILVDIIGQPHFH